MKRCTNIKQSTCLLPIVIPLQMKGKMNKPFPVILMVCALENPTLIASNRRDWVHHSSG